MCIRDSSYVARTEEFDCGVMISASHNPFDDNGIKLLNRSGDCLLYTSTRMIV